MTEILILNSSKNIGDINHVRAVVKELEKIINITKIIEVDANKEFEYAQIDYLFAVSELSMNNESYITLAVGDKSMNLLINLSDNRLLDKNTYIYLGLHQYFNSLSKLINKIDCIMLPKSVVNDFGRREIVSQYFEYGVPNNYYSQIELMDIYDIWEEQNKPPIDKKYIIVTLPGDAPDSYGNQKYFTHQSANQLYQNIYDLWNTSGRDYDIIVQNSLRTGKFDPENGKILCNHEYILGGDPSIAVDHISNYFINLLQSNTEISSQGAKILFYNFAFEMDKLGNKKIISAYNPILAIANSNRDNYYIVPGESISMLREIPHYIKDNKKVIIFKPDSLNTEHNLILNDGLNKGLFSYFEEENLVLNMRTRIDPINEANLVANRINKEFLKKFNDIDIEIGF